MTYKVSNPVGAAIPAIVETTDQENVKQYDLFNIVKPKNILDALSGLFPTINDPFNALPNGYLSRFNQYIGLFGPIDLASLYDSKIVTKVWEVKTKTILQFPYVTNQNGIFTVQKSSWKAPMNFTSTYWTRQLIGADVANSMGFTGQGITTTVIDTGGTQLNKQTPRLKKYTVVDLNYSDTIGHGEWCASCIGGQMAVDDTFSALQGKQVVCQGMAPACNLQEIKALDYVIGTGTDAQLLHALNKAIDIGSDVISCSWGGSETASQPQDDPYYNALQALVNNNVIPVFAAGNSGPNPGTVASPGWLPQALTVGAYNAVDNSQINAFGP
ncbi:MAG: S8 family serine peptidase, partial [Metallosphaera sp.]